MIFLWALCLTSILSCVFARRDCHCGYAITVDDSRYVFTDLIETDFSRVLNLSHNPDWFSPQFNRTGDGARGPLGEQFTPSNVDTVSDESGSDKPSGLRLVVRNSTVDGMVPVAEVDTAREDIHWGSFRVSMQVSDIPGTCAAFFWVSLTVPSRLFLGPTSPHCQCRHCQFLQVRDQHAPDAGYCVIWKLTGTLAWTCVPVS